ncbi:MAG TPA: hypothetical protein VMV49_10310 [Candidatus Deferrimicrobium sp.]|nr:hypothetical protein [Candidatus Deferrimicrobium sp.]
MSDCHDRQPCTWDEGSVVMGIGAGDAHPVPTSLYRILYKN